MQNAQFHENSIQIPAEGANLDLQGVPEKASYFKNEIALEI